jgi:hypothetical protein
VYFPTTASVSMLHMTTGGDSVEVVAVGNEGMVGMPVIMGGGVAAGEAVVRTGGHGFRADSAWLVGEFHARAAVMRLLLRYAHALMTHTAQSAICNKHHSLEQRLCRCFLGSLDQADGRALNLTHESLASMLGVRREGVTCAALKLQRVGLIDYTRGRVIVLDRDALEAQSCECYGVVKAEYDWVTTGMDTSDAVPAMTMPMQPPARVIGRSSAYAADSASAGWRAGGLA